MCLTRLLRWVGLGGAGFVVIGSYQQALQQDHMSRVIGELFQETKKVSGCDDIVGVIIYDVIIYDVIIARGIPSVTSCSDEVWSVVW